MRAQHELVLLTDGSVLEVRGHETIRHDPSTDIAHELQAQRGSLVGARRKDGTPHGQASATQAVAQA